MSTATVESTGARAGAALAMLFAVTLQAAPGDELWDGRFYTKSLNDGARCAAVGSGGDIYLGGSFTSADGVVVSHVARWDGVKWRSLGEGLDGFVFALVVDAAGYVYAGGTFENAGGDPDADHVAVWNGSSWSSLGGPGSRLVDTVHTLAIDPTGNLVAGGEFINAGADPDADRIAIWNGSDWSSIGGPGSGVDNRVNAIAYSPGGQLVIGGAFTNAGGVATADRIAAWNGSSWSALGGGLDGSVYALAFAANGDLYVGGSFTDAGGDPDADRIAVWASPVWRSVGGAGSGLSGTIKTIGISTTGRIFIGGSFYNAGGDPDADRVARWSPTSGWISMGGAGTGLNNDVDALVLDNTGALVVLGWFKNAGGYEDADYVARWSSGRWTPLTSVPLPEGAGLEDYVYAIAVDSGRRLYAGGEFRDAGGDPAGDYIAVWDESGWSAMGPEGSFDGYVYAIVESSDGDIVVGGDFQDAGGDPDADYIAVWDGVTWGSLGGSGTGLNDPVHALIVADDGSLYAGGDFRNAGGDPDADYIAAWNGVAWGALVGPGGGVGGTVLDLALDSSGKLYAGGDFSDAGGDPDADGVAVWNGAVWTSLSGPGIVSNTVVNALAIDHLGRVYAGGDFTDLSGNPDADNIVMWDGVGWTTLAGGLNHVVWDLAVDGVGNLYAAGDFSSDLNPPGPDRIAMWDGAAWSPLGSGLDEVAYALAYDGSFDLFIGGDFSIAGDKASVRIGCYRGAVPADLLFADGFETGDLTAWNQ
jgi:hypothetical protein